MDERLPTHEKNSLDTDFVESGDQPIHLLSVGIVADDGRELYAVNRECPIHRANTFVTQTVLPKIDFSIGKTRDTIRDEIALFTSGDSRPVFWSCCAAWDRLVETVRLLAVIRDRPERSPRLCADLRQCCGSTRSR